MAIVARAGKASPGRPGFVSPEGGEECPGCGGRVGGGGDGGGHGHAVKPKGGEVGKSGGRYAADGEDGQGDLRSGSPEKVAGCLAGEGLGGGGKAGADAEAISAGDAGRPSLVEIVCRAADDPIGPEEPSGLCDVHVLGAQMDAVDARRSGHADVIVERHDRRRRRIRLSGKRNGPPAAVEKHGVGGGLVADLKHRHAGTEQRDEEPLEGSCVGLSVDKHAEPCGSQSVSRVCGVHQVRTVVLRLSKNTSRIV